MKIKILFIFLILVVIASMSFAQGCMDASSEEGVNVVGYLQAQYEYQFGEEEDTSSFTFNRVRVGVLGNIPYDFNYYLMFEFSPNQGGAPYLLDGFITYSRLAPFLNVTLGQFKSPFSLELNTPCQSLHTINRSNVVSILATPFRDKGIMLNGSYKEKVSYALAVTNGAGLNQLENNATKDLAGRLVFDLVEYVSFGGSFGMRTLPSAQDTAQEDDKLTKFAGEIQFKYKNFLLQGEYLTGAYESSGGLIEHPPDCSHPEVWYEEIPEGETTSNGFWVQGMYLTPWNLQPVLKYEQYDPNLDDANSSLASSCKKITTFGLNYFFNDWTRLQLNYLYKAEAENEIPNDEIILQLQVKF